MDTPKIEEEISDDEIHFGKITIKEIKKILCNRNGPITTCDVSSKKDVNTSLRLIETHSQPNLRSKPAESPVFSSNPGSPNFDRKSDDSFIQMENMVSKLCMSPRKSDNLELNNTLEVIDYILNHGPNREPVKKVKTEEDIDNIVSVKSEQSSSFKKSPEKQLSKKTNVQETYLLPKDTDSKGSPNYYTPAKSVFKMSSVITTPSSNNLKYKTPVFKTPANPTLKKPCTPRPTPGRSNAYQHISSPIASYIKNCPQAPLVKDVHPKKPLSGASSIPKFIRNPSQGKIPMVKNKENINLPSIAYKSAKKTKVIQLPDENKLPQSQWVKKITSFPKPTVMKHENREVNLVKKPLLSNQEDSFANLSYHQAEISVCTQKTAFKSTNKH